MKEPRAIEILKEAHDVGLVKLELLATSVQALDSIVDEQSLEGVRETLRFFDNELVVHFRHEEQALFPAMAPAIGWEGPIRAMLDEHKSLWRAIDDLHQEMENLESSSGNEKLKTGKQIKLIANHIVGLLGSHIGKEDAMIFPLAEEHVSGQQMLAMEEDMKAIGAAQGSAPARR